MTIRDDTGLVSDDELSHGPRRPWLGPHRPKVHRWVNPIIEILHVEVAGGVALAIATVAGGMVVPAALYAAVNLSGGALQGWGVPVATDIAFAVGVVALLTMSLFIAGLAFGGDAASFEQAKLGIFAASLVAAGIGVLVLRRA